MAGLRKDVGEYMILVDLQVVSLDRHYQFSLDESKSVLELITEIKDILCQQEQCEMLGEDDDLMLCSVTQNSILKKNMTLSEQGVRSAERLLLFQEFI